MARSSRLWALQYPLPFESYNLCQRANGSAKNFFNYVMCLISLNYLFATVQDQLKHPKGRRKFDITTPLSKNVPLSERIVPKPGVKWLVAANTVRPVPGEARMVLVNLMTGESKPL